MKSKRLRILILDGDTNAGRAVLQSLGRAGHVCWIAAPQRHVSAFASRHAKRRLVYPDPLRDPKPFVDWVAARQQEGGIDHVIPVTELSLVPLHEARDALSPGVAILPPAAALETVLDKQALRSAAVELGIPAPKTRCLPAASTAIEHGDHLVAELAGPSATAAWPVVVKPVRSKLWINGRGTNLHVRLARNPDELAHHLRYLLPLAGVQVQEWVPGTGVGFEALVRHGDVVLEFAHERLHEYPLTGGASTYRRSWNPPAPMRDAATRLLAQLGWHGVAMVEFRFDTQTGRFWIMEVNGRFWGSLPLALFAGVDFPKALVDLWRGGAVETRRPRSRIVTARHVTGEIQWCKAALGWRASAGLPIPPPALGRAMLGWLRVLGGREIWDGASLRDPLPLLYEIGTGAAREVRGGVRKLRRTFRTSVARRSARARLAAARHVRRVLFVCYGNICRSPYAAVRMAEWGGGLRFETRSAGTHATSGGRSPDMIQRLAAARGVELRRHVSGRIDRENLAWAEIVVVMDGPTQRAVAALDPGSSTRTVRLGALDPQGGADIPDPYLLSAEEAALVLEKIDRSVGTLAEALDPTT